VNNISELIKNKKIIRDPRNSYEHQAYGNRLAEELHDIKHRALYIRLAKNEDRNLLELARIFVTSQKDITEGGRLFMWKLKQIKDNKLNKQPK
jgi:hypothetical protein